MNQKERAARIRPPRSESPMEAFEEERGRIESMVAEAAPSCDLLLSVVSSRYRGLVDLTFIVSEPLYDGETQVLPLVGEAIEMSELLLVDFVIVRESVAPQLEALDGARLVYERCATTSHAG